MTSSFSNSAWHVNIWQEFAEEEDLSYACTIQKRWSIHAIIIRLCKILAPHPLAFKKWDEVMETYLQKVTSLLGRLHDFIDADRMWVDI